VARDVWERVQGILDGRQTNKAGKSTRSFTYTGLLSCGHCECSLVGELKKARYVYYHCTGYRGKCGEPYTREEALEQQFAIGLKDLVIAPAILQNLRTEVVESDRTEKAARAQLLRRDQAELERLRTRLGVLYEDRLDGRIDASTYDMKAAQLHLQEKLMRQRTQLGETTPIASTSDAVNFLAGISEAAKRFAEQDSGRKRGLLRLMLEKAEWKGGELRMSFKTPFRELGLSNSVTICNQNSLQANCSESDNWRRERDSNPR
jgi:site-specific DNA recombinase